LIPDPLNETVLGLFAALWAIDKVADLVPVLLGVKVTSTLHVAPGAIEAPQVVVSAN